MDDVASVAAQGPEQRSVAVHDDKAKLLVGLEQLAQGFGVEFVVTEIERCVDWLKGLKVDVDLSFLAFRSDDFTTVNDQSVWWGS